MRQICTTTALVWAYCEVQRKRLRMIGQSNSCDDLGARCRGPRRCGAFRATPRREADQRPRQPGAEGAFPPPLDANAKPSRRSAAGARANIPAHAPPVRARRRRVGDETKPRGISHRTLLSEALPPSRQVVGNQRRTGRPRSRLTPRTTRRRLVRQKLPALGVCAPSGNSGTMERRAWHFLGLAHGHFKICMSFPVSHVASLP